jgi:hypothetical protein
MWVDSFKVSALSMNWSTTANLMVVPCLIQLATPSCGIFAFGLPAWISSKLKTRVMVMGKTGLPDSGTSPTVKPDPDLKLKLEAVKADVISWALAMPEKNAIAFYCPSQKTNELSIYALMQHFTATAPRASSITACVPLMNLDSCPITCCTRCIPPTAKSMATRRWG